MAENIEQNKPVTFSESRLTLINRNNLAISGVEKVVGANETCVHLVVAGDKMYIEGVDLHVSKLDVEQGVIVLDGTIGTIRYSNGKKQNILKKMFK